MPMLLLLILSHHDMNTVLTVLKQAFTMLVMVVGPWPSLRLHLASALECTC